MRLTHTESQLTTWQVGSNLFFKSEKCSLCWYWGFLEDWLFFNTLPCSHGCQKNLSFLHSAFSLMILLPNSFQSFFFAQEEGRTAEPSDFPCKGPCCCMTCVPGAALGLWSPAAAKRSFPSSTTQPSSHIILLYHSSAQESTGFATQS